MLAPGPHVTGAGSAAVRLKQLRAAFVARSQQVNMAHNRYKCLSKHNDVRPLCTHAATPLSVQRRLDVCGHLEASCQSQPRGRHPIALRLWLRKWLVQSCLRSGIAMSASDFCLLPRCTATLSPAVSMPVAAQHSHVPASPPAQLHPASTADDRLLHSVLSSVISFYIFLQLYKTYVRVSSDLAEAPPPPGSPRSTVSPPPGGYSSHTSSASESEALTSAGLAQGLGGFSNAGRLLSPDAFVQWP